MRIRSADTHLPRDSAMEPVMTLFVRVARATHSVRRPPPVVAKDNGEWKVDGDLIGRRARWLKASAASPARPTVEFPA